MRLRFFRWIAAFGLAGAGACSLVVDTNALVDGERLPSDASTNADVSQLDAPDVSDGSSDAKDASMEAEADAPADAPSEDVDAGTFCENVSPTPTICSDFDAQSLPAGWDSLAGYGEFFGVVDQVAATSPPRSILFTTPELADGDMGSRVLVKKLATPTSLLSIEFDMLGESVDGWTWFVVIESDNANGSVVARFRMHAGGFDINESSEPAGGTIEYAGHAVSGTPSPTAWRHVVWTLDFTGTQAFSNVDIDGAISGGPSEMKAYLDEPTLKLGISFAETPSAAKAIRFDNIVVRVE